MEFKAVFFAFLTVSLLAAGPVRGQDDRPIYVSMLPHFVVNLGPSQFMRLKAQVLVEDKDTEAAMKLHMPAIRHDLLMLFSELRARDLDSAEKIELFSKAALASIRKTLTENQAPAAVAGFFITDLVIQ